MSIGFIVEGHMEADIVRSICKAAHIRRLSMNGRDVPAAKIAEKAHPHIEILRKKTSCVVLLIDLEQRNQEATAFESDICSELDKRGVSRQNLVVSVPDRNIESWIAPYVDNKGVLCAERCGRGEGVNGKAILKGIYRSLGKPYVETIDGVKLFKALNPGRLAQDSPSFRRFCDLFKADCWWLNSV
jgi:hypothetical protein